MLNFKKYQKDLKSYVEEYKDNYEYTPDQGVPTFIEEELIYSFLTKRDNTPTNNELDEIIFQMEEIQDQATQSVISGKASDSLSEMISIIEDM